MSGHVDCVFLNAIISSTKEETPTSHTNRSDDSDMGPCTKAHCYFCSKKDSVIEFSGSMGVMDHWTRMGN